MEKQFEDFIKEQAQMLTELQAKAYQTGYLQGQKDKEKELLGEGEKDEAKVSQIDNIPF